jgi:hypothetical protein
MNIKIKTDMRNRYLFVILILMIISLISCLKGLICITGNGIKKTEVRRLNSFSKIENSTSINIVYKKADTIGITIEADENLLDHISTETSNNTLKISTGNGATCLDFVEKPLITISSPRLESIFVSGSGTFSAEEMSGNSTSVQLSGSGNISVSKITGTDMTVFLSGSGDINISNSNCVSSDIFLSGSGKIGIAGLCDNSHMRISGSGQINAENWMLTAANILISGSGDIHTSVEQKLTALISGSGNIYLKGDPEISQTISGSGRIIKYK